MSDRHFFSNSQIESAATLYTEFSVIKSGTISGAKGILIDATLVDCHISSSDGSLIVISALAKLENCTIEAHDLLIEGRFVGSIVAKGKVELGAGCTVIGQLSKADEVYMHPLSDVEDLKTKTLPRAAKVVESGDSVSDGNDAWLKTGTI